MEQDYNLKKWSKGCPNTGINCRRSSCGIEYVFIPAALGDDQEGSPVAPKNGSYNNAIVYYEATGNVYLYSSDGVPTRVEKNLDSIIAELQRELNDVEEALSEETSAREAADAAIEQEIEDLRNEPDVVDIVGTYTDLQAYNTSDLGDKDIIRVLVDETHDDESTYYRWNKTPQTWTYIGAIDGYYTKDQTDTLLEGKQDVLTAGTNVQISSQNVISATDTTYSDFTGTDGTAAGTSGLVPAPSTTDAGKFLKADGTWETVQAGGGATIFYIGGGLIGRGEDIEGPLFYKDSSYQTPATASEMYAACMAGPTYICSNQSDDLLYTEIVAMSNYSTNYNFSLTNIEHDLGYDCTIASYISSGTEYYNFYYNEPSTINVVQTTGSSTTNVMSQNAVTTGLAGKQDTLTAGANITIDANNVISAAGGGSGPTVVQATGTSTTDVMSQNAATSMVFPNNDTQRVQIGAGASTVAYTQGVAIGRNAHARSTTTVAIGSGATAEDVSGVAIGNLSDAAEPNSVALGGSAVTSRRGEVNVGTGRYNYGYNSTPYRVIGGVHDGQTAHDVATVGQLNGRVLTSAGAPTTSTVGTVGQILEDTTNGKLYICTAIVPGTDPDPDTYTWEELNKTYIDFVGTDGTAAGTAGLVPAPAIADAEKFLKSDGTWGVMSPVVNLSVVIDNDSWGTPALVYPFGSGVDKIGVVKLSAAQGNQGLFQNDDSGEFVTEGELYEMIASGTRVKLNHVPVGQSLTSPHTYHPGTEYVNGIELTNEFVTEVDGAPISVYSATVPFLLYVSESGNYPPLGVFLMKTSQEAPYDDTYGFYVQGRFPGTPQ